MRRRTRRSRVTWLPNLVFTTDGDENTNLCTGVVAVDPRAVSTTEVFPLVRDEQPDATDVILSDYTQSGYLLKRVVGKFFCGMAQLPSEAEPAGPITSTCIVTAALEIIRVGPDNNALANAQAEVVYNPLAELNERDPWIWQRSWCFSNGNMDPTQFPTTNAIGNTFAFFPYTNAEYGSVADGPHVDAKTARRVGPEERLCLTVTTNSLIDQGANAEGGAVPFVFQYRVLGVPIRSSNRRNASR